MRLTLGAIAAVAAGIAGPAAFAQERGPGPPVTIEASVGHSEWCRNGTVRLNLATGRYLVRAPRTWLSCRRPAWRRAVSTGILPAGDLRAVREAWRRAEAEGLDNPACRNGGRPPQIVIMNTYPWTLRLTNGRRTSAAPNDLSCWSEAARQFELTLEHLFSPRPAGRR